MVALRERRQQSRRRLLPLRAERPFDKPAWFRELPQNSFVWQLAGVGGTTLHYFGNSPRAMPGVFSDYTGADADQYDIAHRFPFSYRELIPYYEWVEATLPVQTAAMGTKEAVFFRGCENVGLPVNTTKDILFDSFRPQENAILQPQGTAGQTNDSSQLRYPQAQGCTFCGYCFQGCLEPREAPRNLKAKRSTDNSYVPMALTADHWAPGGRPATLVSDAFVKRILYAQEGSRAVARGVRWRDTQTGERARGAAQVVVLSAGCTEGPRLWLNSGLPNPNDWVGRGYTDHFFDWLIGVFDEYTGNSKGASSSARADFPGRGGLENVGLPPALKGFAMGFSDSGVRGVYDNGRGPTGRWDGKAGRVSARSSRRCSRTSTGCSTSSCSPTTTSSPTTASYARPSRRTSTGRFRTWSSSTATARRARCPTASSSTTAPRRSCVGPAPARCCAWTGRR